MPTNPANPTLPGWGVQKSLGSPYEGCIITDWECATEPQVAYCQDQNGAVVHRQDYDVKRTVTATLLAPATAEPPEPDATLTVGGTAFAVLACREIESNRDFRKLALTLEAYENWPGAGA